MPTITPLGDFANVWERRDSSCLASLLWRKKMLEWKPRFIVLLVLLTALSALFGQFGWGPLQFGWGAF